MHEIQTPVAEDLLEDIQTEWENEDATKGQRFLNYLVDIVSFYIVLFAAGFFIAIIPGGDAYIDSLDNVNPLLERVVSLLLYGLFMSLTEGLFRGRTLGKICTRTKAVRENGDTITWGDAFARGFSRTVPFEALSALGYSPWHDKWTHTRVIKVKK